MELLFESRLEILRAAGKLHFFQRPADVTPEPVVVADRPTDAEGAYIYGSVLHDQGVYRMWYQAQSPAWARHDTPVVAYAESDDGITWRKPDLNLVEFEGSRQNNLCDLGFHCHSVAIDPEAPPEQRYLATGCIDARYQDSWYHRDADPPVGGGYYIAHSADGLRWELESPHPHWRGHNADNIETIWHPGRGRIETLLKRNRPYGGISRRSWWECSRKGGEWSEPRLALVPDDFDDLCAMSRGYASGDFNGIGRMPVGRATVGFIQTHRNRLPWHIHPNGSEAGNVGVLDLTLVYQGDEGHCWLRTPGRPDFVTHHHVPWANRCLFCASNVCEFGDEQRLYLGGWNCSHGVEPPDEIKSSIGYASWPKDRIFGFHADPTSELEIELGILETPVELALNYETEPGGSIRVRLHTLGPWERLQDTTDYPGYGLKEAIPLTGDALAETISWKRGSVIRPLQGCRVVARLYMQRAKAYAWEIRPLPDPTIIRGSG